jgi:excinuclease ABC subunit A
MGPKGGVEGGRIIAEGTLDDIIHNKESITAKYLK